MPRFLHVADIHLGFDRYDHPERTKDFFLAFYDALERYAVKEAVDFVLLAGDLFEHRNVLPSTLNQAQACFRMLQEAGIPVLAIEGNHDNRPYGTPTSWLRYLAEWGWLVLLEPAAGADETEIYQPWNQTERQGGYIDLACGVRVLGSSWYGASAPQMIERLAAAVRSLPPGPPHTIMMFHHGLENQIARYSGALRYSDLLPLKQAGIDYLALGHIHKNYAEEGWIFNPGSVEANSIAESQDQMPRGVYLVEIDSLGIRPELKRDYRQRPIVRLELEVSDHWLASEVVERAEALIETAWKQGKTAAAIVELKLIGRAGFTPSDLNVRELEQQLFHRSKALIFRLRYDVQAPGMATPVTEQRTRAEIEQEVFQRLLASYAAYRDRAESLTQLLLDVKSRIGALPNTPPEAQIASLYETIAAALFMP